MPPTKKQRRIVEDDDAVGGMRRPAISVAKVPGLIKVGHNLRAALFPHVVQWAEQELVHALVEHCEPERLEQHLAKVRAD
eukprot:323067-Amphidinium_carterae.1